MNNLPAPIPAARTTYVTTKKTRRNIALGAALAATVMLAVSPVSTDTEAIAATVPKDFGVKVMTWNILSATVNPEKDPAPNRPWTVRDDFTVKRIKAENPDVIGFQENYSVSVGGRSVKQLTTIDDEKLGAYTFAQMESFNPIAFRTSKFKLNGSGIVQIAWNGQENSNHDRYLTWAKLTDRATNRAFMAFNAHLSAYGAEDNARARSAQVTKMVAAMRRADPNLDIPYVVTGDFNSRNNDTRPIFRDVEAKMVAAGAQDTRKLAKAITSEVVGAHSFSDFGTEVDGTWRYLAVRRGDEYIDYIWTTPKAVAKTWKVSSGQVRQVTVNGKSYPYFANEVKPSDHSPVVSEIVFPAATTSSPSWTVVNSTPVASPVPLVVGDKVAKTYAAAGGEKKFGKPVAAQVKVTVSGTDGYHQEFARGEVFWSTKGSQAFSYPYSPNLSGVDNERDALAPISFARGMLYRNANMCKASLDDKLRLAGMLKGGRIIDLRDAASIKKCPDPSLPGVTRVNRVVNPDAIYSKYVTEAARRTGFRDALNDATEDADPVLVHCSAGKDRTGWAVAMIMYAAGATDHQVRNEYRRTASVDAAKLKEFDAAIALAKKNYGSIYGYIRNGLGVSEARYGRLMAKFGPQR